LEEGLLVGLRFRLGLVAVDVGQRVGVVVVGLGPRCAQRRGGAVWNTGGKAVSLETVEQNTCPLCVFRQILDSGNDGIDWTTGAPTRARDACSCKERPVSSSEDFFYGHPVFTHEEYARSRVRGSPRTVDSLLRQHVESGRIARVRRGLYVSVPRGGTAESVDPYLVATKATDDAAVSHHAALQFHGRTYSMWGQVTFLTGAHTRGFDFGPMVYAPVRPPAVLAALPHWGGGIETVLSGGGQVRVCTCERAMVDVLHTPALGGGWEEIWRSLELVEFVDLDTVVSYALRLDSATTVARVGLFLDQHRERLFVEEAHLKRLVRYAPKDPRYLDTSREPGRLVHPWNLIVPERVLYRRWEEVL
jgi:predicted transcriptional regulator of viral defense system